MRKLVLIIPPSPWLISDTDLPPLGPLYISSFVKRAGFEVQVCDLSGLKQKDWKFPIGDIYAVGGTSPNWPQVWQIIDTLKNRGFKSTVLVGGVHATLLPEVVLRQSRADACVIGEGEQTILDVLKVGVNRTVSGLAFRENGNIVYTKPRPFETHLDFIPMPDYEAIDFYKYSLSKTFQYLMGKCYEGTVITSRGCPFNCSFCASPKLWGRKVRYRSTESVVEEAKYLMSRFGITLIYFVDDTFILNKRRVKALCDKIKPLGLKWHCLNRVDKANGDLMSVMKAAGCLGVVYGFESGDNVILKKMNKGTTVAMAYRAIEMTKQAGLKIRGQMIVGFPGETDESVENTAKFMRQAKEVDVFGVHVFQPVPGSAVWENPEKYGLELNKNNFDYGSLTTIGKPGAILSDSPKVMEWYNYLRSVAAERNVELHGANDA